MRYDKLMAIVSRSEPDAWIYHECRRTYVFREDLNIRIEQYVPSEADPFDEVREGWATNHLEPQAHKVYFDIYYGASFVERFTLASIDGGRAFLPFPISVTDLRVPRSRYLLAHAIDHQGSLDDYMKRCNMSVVETERSLT